jgi:hypothetical protein
LHTTTQQPHREQQEEQEATVTATKQENAREKKQRNLQEEDGGGGGGGCHCHAAVSAQRSFRQPALRSGHSERSTHTMDDKWYGNSFLLCFSCFFIFELPTN